MRAAKKFFGRELMYIQRPKLGGNQHRFQQRAFRFHTDTRARALMHAKEEKTLAKFHIHYNGLNE